MGFYDSRAPLRYLYWLAVLIMVAGTVAYGRCPLVELEEALRAAGGASMPYEGSFTVYFLAGLTGQEIPEAVPLLASRLVVLLTLASLLRPAMARRLTAQASRR